MLCLQSTRREDRTSSGKKSVAKYTIKLSENYDISLLVTYNYIFSNILVFRNEVLSSFGDLLIHSILQGTKW